MANQKNKTNSFAKQGKTTQPASKAPQKSAPARQSGKKPQFAAKGK